MIKFIFILSYEIHYFSKLFIFFSSNYVKIVDGKLQLNETPQVVNKEEVSQKKIRKRKLAKKKKLRYLL